ncbi:MAG: hypothetical protein EXQ95_08335 [Alphaproteobacteria bacterium]|nr:hypothetical protein [Alphaproteobacteria bacterium]
MSALAHIIETHGVATVVISLIRLHTEKIRPPRALWVPFQLGRPLGSPGEPAFQTRVLRRALALLERRDGPVILEDFAEDEPRSADDPAWSPPFAATAGAVDGRRLHRELDQVLPAYRQAVAARARSTVGLAGVPLPEAVAFIGWLLSGSLPVSPSPALTAAQALRFIADDLKAAWTEAASLTGKPSSRQLADWLWERTVLGRALLRIRELALQSEDSSFKAAGGSLLVPGARVALLEAVNPP